jgi:hypothetical protein
VVHRSREADRRYGCSVDQHEFHSTILNLLYSSGRNGHQCDGARGGAQIRAGKGEAGRILISGMLVFDFNLGNACNKVGIYMLQHRLFKDQICCRYFPSIHRLLQNSYLALLHCSAD